ncbi:rhoptry kinase family protein (incomplete catalytic triad) [Besnoitia besnoiti]|uniref:Rhoptry kinase family protein (Incomplete catalytic triad) n=1 Tax=Besnoitia besnoiti TaxID=94643 RepID=A0A2A9MFQ8_BESBE|nr:rhoptry kinase family protein (incomplete catalytic triad) [Besnoitia besnoiti]PFH34493.1 rhoptry kinase family protein (incomplete catalytic triad) [Besnoitia besnoiti]
MVLLELTAEFVRVAVSFQEGHIVHRNLTARSLFVMSSGSVLLGDFGFSRTAGTTGPYLGTRRYKGPEVVENPVQPLVYHASVDAWHLEVV